MEIKVVLLIIFCLLFLAFLIVYIVAIIKYNGKLEQKYDRLEKTLQATQEVGTDRYKELDSRVKRIEPCDRDGNPYVVKTKTTDKEIEELKEKIDSLSKEVHLIATCVISENDVSKWWKGKKK